MSNYRKKRANPYHFSLVPETLWNPKKPLPALVFSRILAGMAHEDKVYETTTQRTFVIKKGHSWLSLETVREDISSAIGQVLKRHVIVYAVEKLKKAGLVESFLQDADSCGRFGTVFVPNADYLASKNTVDPVKEFKIHAYGNVSAFRLGAIGHAPPGVEWKQRQPGDVRNLMDAVAKGGNPESLFRSVGMWRDRKDVREIGTPVFLPWIILDVDIPGNMPEALEHTHRILFDLEDEGIDLSRTFVSFSGNKGYHIAIATSQIGNPIFRDSTNARETIIRFVARLTSEKIDPSTFSPLQMLRLTGSRHQSTGLYKTTWVATEFRSLQLHTILEASKTHSPWEYPDPTIGEIEDDVHAIFETVAEEQAKYAWEQIQARASGVDQGWNRPGSSLRRVLRGVAHGEEWGGRTGRDWAAFTLACYCLAHEKQHETVRVQLGMSLDKFDESYDSVRETLARWNQLNSPPLTEKEISQKVGSAERYLARKL